MHMITFPLSWSISEPTKVSAPVVEDPTTFGNYWSLFGHSSSGVAIVAFGIGLG